MYGTRRTTAGFACAKTLILSCLGNPTRPSVDDDSTFDAQNPEVDTKIGFVDPLRILVVATKSPWPPVDGGRVVLLNTITALAAAGHSIDLVAPCPEHTTRASSELRRCCKPHLTNARPRPIAAAVLRSFVTGVPVSVARHSVSSVRETVAALIDEERFDVVHAEQLHALPQARAAARKGLAVVHRAHNVESRLWAYATAHRGPLLRTLLAFEARRMSALEGRVLEHTTCTVALTEPDRRAFSELVPGAVVHTIEAPHPAELPADPEPVEGDPAVVTLSSGSWAPSRDAVRRLASTIWPDVRRRLPGAVLHVFGGGGELGGFDGVVPHPPPDDSRRAFPRNAVVVLPQRHPTGVPMKALEAWARGLPLIVDEPTVEILNATDGVELLAARGAGGYADALVRLHDEPHLAPRLIEAGRLALRSRHDPAAIAARLDRVYRWAATQQAVRR